MNLDETASPLGAWVPFALWTAFWLVALLASGWRGLRPGVWVAKPLASAGFIAAALACGATESPYGLAILTALVLSMLGDVLLIPEGSGPFFLAGLVSFLLGHLGFAVAFVVSGVSLPGAAIAAVAIAGPVWAVLRWLRPHVPDDMKIPVMAYVGVISAMVVTAAGATAAGGTPTMLAGAVLFYLSDLGVARDRFVSPGFGNGLVGLPLYYGAQVVLAVSILG
ncbi:MAG: lysoplasmalogenase [Myxococcota bacterium]